MNKYESAKTLKLTKARSQWTYEACGAVIEKETEYFRESLGPIAKSPELRLGSFCIPCGRARSSTLVHRATHLRRKR
jgi:hypothetical protein